MAPIAGTDRLMLTRHRNVVVGDDRALRRAAARGDLKRLRIGAYVPTGVWDALGRDERHRLAAAAAAEMNDAFVAAHRTAATLLGVPTIGRGDGLVHARATVAAGTRTEHGYRKHAVADPEQHVTSVEGVRTTTLDRTIVDLALSETFESAVAATDWALAHGATKESLRRTLQEAAPKQGGKRVETVIAFSDPRSGCVGESYSRVVIAREGFPAPLLQTRFDDARGLIGFVDFFWPEFRLIGEFDGLEKYSRAEYLGERAPSDVVSAEKEREDRLRATATRPGVSRWLWDTVHTSGALGVHLRAAGLPVMRRLPGVIG